MPCEWQCCGSQKVQITDDYVQELDRKHHSWLYLAAAGYEACLTENTQEELQTISDYIQQISSLLDRKHPGGAPDYFWLYPADIKPAWQKTPRRSSGSVPIISSRISNLPDRKHAGRAPNHSWLYPTGYQTSSEKACMSSRSWPFLTIIIIDNG